MIHLIRRTSVAVQLPRGGGNFPFDGRAHQVSPLRPRAVVVPDVLVTEQILQHEPRMRAALTDAAVGDDFLVPSDALAAVELAERVGGLEGAVFSDGLRPRNAGRAGNVPAALRGFGHPRRRDHLAAILIGGPDENSGKVIAP